jgi:hypothetical protein
MKCKQYEKSATTKGESPSRLIDARITELDDWRGKALSHVRALIKQADPEVVEEWKWRGCSARIFQRTGKDGGSTPSAYINRNAVYIHVSRRSHPPNAIHRR